MPEHIAQIRAVSKGEATHLPGILERIISVQERIGTLGINYAHPRMKEITCFRQMIRHGGTAEAWMFPDNGKLYITIKNISPGEDKFNKFLASLGDSPAGEYAKRKRPIFLLPSSSQPKLFLFGIYPHAQEEFKKETITLEHASPGILNLFLLVVQEGIDRDVRKMAPDLFEIHKAKGLTAEELQLIVLFYKFPRELPTQKTPPAEPTVAIRRTAAEKPYSQATHESAEKRIAQERRENKENRTLRCLERHQALVSNPNNYATKPTVRVVLSQEQMSKIKEGLSRGDTYAKIAKVAGIPLSTFGSMMNDGRKDLIAAGEMSLEEAHTRRKRK